MKLFTVGVALLFAATTTFARLPHKERTPGVTNPEVTQATIHQTICVPGWTATVRPPSSYTTKLKREQIKEYRYQEKRLSEFEEDHLISLQLGGHPRDPRNLWPQPYRIKCGARIKDVLETKLKRLVCDGTITLAAAQKAIATNWIAAYKKYVDKERCPEIDEK